jgi:dihydroorotate dehydrogenase
VSWYSALARPVLFALDAERAHDLTLSALQLRIAAPALSLSAPPDDPQLHQQAFGLLFRNPLGLAAGLDKQGIAGPAWSAAGFGFAEIGTVTLRPQPGNPKPRLFRLRQDHAVINRFGFNSDGAAAVATNVAGWNRPRERRCLLGINIGRNKDTPNDRAIDDYLQLVDVLNPFADYFVLNVSSPNTAGLRALQAAESLRPLVEQVVNRVRKSSRRATPVLVKLSPDMSDHELCAAADAAVAGGANGIVATNTTIGRTGLTTTGPLRDEAGGMSGAPLRARANEVCRLLFRHLRGSVPIIGVGGIFSVDAAYERIRSGASLVQIYTGLIYEGPAIVARVVTGVAERLDRDGFRNVAEAVGIDAN